MHQVTVAQVLQLGIFQEGHPQLISQPGYAAFQELVRWMHILETEKPEGLLPGGEFVLTTATFLDQSVNNIDDGIETANRFFDSIEKTGAAAIAAEILDGRQPVTEILTHAAKDRVIPIYILPKRIRFVELMQTTHEMIAAVRLEEIQTDRRIHDAFTRLSVGSASTARIVAEATTLIGCQVRWEASEHEHSRPVSAEQHVVAGAESLGRLVVADDCGADAPLVKNVLKRASQAMSISVLAKRSQDEIRRSTASSLFYQLRSGTELSEEEVLWRLAQTAGHYVQSGLIWFPIVFRIMADNVAEELLNRWSGILLDVLDNVGDTQKRSVFAARSEIGVVDLLIPIENTEALQDFVETTRARFTARLRGQSSLVAGLATSTTSVRLAAERLADAAEIARTAEAYVTATGEHRPFFGAKDLGLRGLLATLKDNEQLVAFVSAELSGVFAGSQNRADFESRLEFLEALLTTENKTALAQKRHVSRPALYSQIKRLVLMLGYDPEDNAEQRTALHLAVMTYRMNPDKIYRLCKLHNYQSLNV